MVVTPLSSKCQPVLVVVVVEMVAGVAGDINADDGQSKKLRGDDTNDSENGRCKKEPDRDRARDRGCECSSGRHKSERERN